jgi:hypothetical protein
LARGAATHGAVVLVGAPYRLSGCAAGAVITGRHGRGDWSGGHRELRLLSGLHSRFLLNKRIGHPDLGEAPVVLTLPEASFGPAVSNTSTHEDNSEFRISDRREKTSCHSHLS